MVDGGGMWLRVSQDGGASSSLREGGEPQALRQNVDMFRPRLDLWSATFCHVLQSAHAIRKPRNYIFAQAFSSSPILHPCWHPNKYFLLTHRIRQVTDDCAFQLSQIFTPEASSPPLSRFESSYRSVRATQPSSFSQSRRTTKNILQQALNL